MEIPHFSKHIRQSFKLFFLKVPSYLVLFLHLLLPLEAITRSLSQQSQSGGEDRGRNGGRARGQVGQGGEKSGWTEVSLQEEGGREELVAPHDLQTPSEEVTAVLQQSCGERRGRNEIT